MVISQVNQFLIPIVQYNQRLLLYQKQIQNNKFTNPIMTNSKTETQTRHSYSLYGRILDRKLNTYIKTTRSNSNQSQKQNPEQSKHIRTEELQYQNINKQNKNKKQKGTASFLAVPRTKKGNFRFSVKQCKQELKYQPNYSYFYQKPSICSFSKAQKYNKQKNIEYQLCRKNPLLKFFENSSRKELKTSKQQLFPIRNTWFSNTPNIEQQQFKNKSPKHNKYSKTFTQNFDYSIISKKEVSNVQRYMKSKISSSFYLQKQALMKIEMVQQKLNNKRKKSEQKIYIDIKKQTQRAPNIIKQYSKTQKHFNNFQSLISTSPNKIHDFKSYLPHKTFNQNKKHFGQSYDLLNVNLDKVRKNTKSININISKFRKKIMTRYDRAQPQPNTRLNYDYNDSIKKNIRINTCFQTQVSRNQELFPLPHPNIKKSGDIQIKLMLKNEIKSNNQKIII